MLAFGCMSTKAYVRNSSRLRKIRRIAVLPFASNHPAMGATIAESLAGQLVASRFVILERARLKSLLAEQQLTIEGILDGDESYVGKLRGVDGLVFGSATIANGFAGLANGGNIDYVSACTARLVDVSTGEVVFATNFKTSGPSTMSGVASPGEVADRLARDFVDQ